MIIASKHKEMNIVSGGERLVKQNNINQIKRYVSRVQQEGLFTKLESVATKLIRDLRFGSKKAFRTNKMMEDPTFGLRDSTVTAGAAESMASEPTTAAEDE